MEWRIEWQQCPRVQHLSKVAFVEAPDQETAKQILTDHIERYLGVRWFVIDHVAQYLRPQGGHVITN